MDTLVNGFGHRLGMSLFNTFSEHLNRSLNKEEAGICQLDENGNHIDGWHGYPQQLRNIK
ncbi:MAG: hypothetical protein HOH43_24880 [Candidatus Latescibacteria bacterium]|nr:hypothetical protein [Candidatus Latescibacterota bacterium]